MLECSLCHKPIIKFFLVRAHKNTRIYLACSKRCQIDLMGAGNFLDQVKAGYREMAENPQSFFNKCFCLEPVGVE